MSQCRRPGLAVFAAFDNAVHSPARSPTGVSKGKKRKAEALEDLSQEQKNARANEAAETAMMAAAERDTWRPGVDCFWF